jgi:hypothetical protein
MNRRQFCNLALAVYVLVISQSIVCAQERITSNEAAARVVEIRNVTENNETITGEVINKSFYNLRNVELLVQYHWLWTDEMRPGPLSPGRSVYVMLNQEIRPGERAMFTYRPDPPLGTRQDGRYMSEVSVAGFSQIIP